MDAPQQPHRNLPLWRRRWLRVTAGIVALFILVAAITLTYVAHHIEPFVRARLVKTISERFNAPVQLDHLSVSAISGLEVVATGLRVGYPTGIAPAADDTSQRFMVTAQRLTFHTGFRTLLNPQTNLSLVYVEGLEIHVPPSSQRAAMQPASDPKKVHARPDFFIHHVLCTNAKIFIDTDKPNKLPLEFDLHQLDLINVDWALAFHYDASLTNPKPKGELAVHGSFGPWQIDEPRTTPIDGDYTFLNADLSTIRGISGTLSSTGHFAGQLKYLTVDGTTDTPNFSIDTANHPLPLHTQFHALVDATTGDTTLAPVNARLRNSSFTAAGTIARIPGPNGIKGHDIALTVDMPHARIEDMLALAVKTDPPLMRGTLSLKNKLHIPPGPERVAEKIELSGHLTIGNVAFSNTKVQDKVDSLSMRAQGRPEDAKYAGSALANTPLAHTTEVSSDMQADFTLAHAMATVTNLHYQVPGALVLLDGVYSLDGQVFEFKGHVRTDARASQMVTGWKSILLMPFDKMLQKNGAGVELPIQISGTKGDPHIGLALDGAKESTQQMQQDIKAKSKAAPKPH